MVRSQQSHTNLVCAAPCVSRCCLVYCTSSALKTQVVSVLLSVFFCASWSWPNIWSISYAERMQRPATMARDRWAQPQASQQTGSRRSCKTGPCRMWSSSLKVYLKSMWGQPSFGMHGRPGQENIHKLFPNDPQTIPNYPPTIPRPSPTFPQPLHRLATNYPKIIPKLSSHYC